MYQAPKVIGAIGIFSHRFFLPAILGFPDSFLHFPTFLCMSAVLLVLIWDGKITVFIMSNDWNIRNQQTKVFLLEN